MVAPAGSAALATDCKLKTHGGAAMMSRPLTPRLKCREVLAIAAAVLLSGGAAQAGLTLNATFGYVPVGDSSFAGASLGSATSVTIAGLDEVNTVPSTYLGNPNDFFSGANAVSLGDSVTVNPLTLNVSNIN